MEHRVLGSTNIKIDSTALRIFYVVSGHPVAFSRFVDEPGRGVWRHETQVVPAGTRPLRHRIQFPRGTVEKLDPLPGLRQRRLDRSSRAIVFQGRWNDRKLRLRQRFMLSVPPD